MAPFLNEPVHARMNDSFVVAFPSPEVHTTCGINFSQGALDGGLDISHSDKRFSGFSKDSKQLDVEVHRKYIYGGHVAAYMKILMEDEPKKYQSHFVEYIKRELSTMALRSHKKVHLAICVTHSKEVREEPPKRHRENKKHVIVFSQENLKWE
ncbi:60S ribosomal protein L5 [Camellia lanceoleosa]|uniref:60S ribosomal protein L5 n=1 Tax=Camellia lanceoleosa TaxID=1840588 RepID=A0ACC0HV84_9ERIC|nr:60S ribosomal protein L5 [Camellia lanceoleosa]